MLNISHADASRSILNHVEEGTLVQQKWHGHDSHGREIACLLGAIHPSVTSPAECNGDLMPMWLAEVTPTLFDGIAVERIYFQAKRYGELVGRWHVLGPSQWQSVLNRFLICVIDEALKAARPVASSRSYWAKVEEACQQCKAAIESGKSAVTAAVIAVTAADAADAAARAADDAAARAARAAAADAADAAALAAAGAPAAAARAAAAAARAAAGAAADKLFTFLLDQIEMECAA